MVYDDQQNDLVNLYIQRYLYLLNNNMFSLFFNNHDLVKLIFRLQNNINHV